jgi:16S rRNA (guanine527-N7)-methyltransferase
VAGTEGGGKAAPRRELPADARDLAPMGEGFTAALAAGLLELGIADGPAGKPAARQSYELHARLLREWGAAINLTAIREPSQIARRHVCDSLSAVPRLARLVRPGASLLDIGSGAGYPGLPLAAALPLGRVGLLDSVGKKARFLAVAATVVHGALSTRGAGPPHAETGELHGEAAAQGGGDGTTAEASIPFIEAIAERAEDLAEDPEHRGAWDIVTARAVGSLAEVLELAMPLTREGGIVVAWKREEEHGGLRAELRDAGSIIRATGGGRPEVVAVEAAGLPGHRLIIVSKERPTPASYPRPRGVRRRREHRARGLRPG